MENYLDNMQEEEKLDALFLLETNTNLLNTKSDFIIKGYCLAIIIYSRFNAPTIYDAPAALDVICNEC